MARMTKEELRDDPVLDWIEGAMEYTQKNSRTIGLVIAAVVVVGLGAWMIMRSQASGRIEASQMLAEGQSLTIQGNYAQAEIQLQDLLSKHGGSEAARSGRIYLGDVYYAQGRYEEALATYEEAIANTKGELLSAAERGKACALESLGRFGEASLAYEAAAAVETTFHVDDLINAGRTALEGGDPARATQILKRAEDLKLPQGQIQAKISRYLAAAEVARAQSS